MVALKLQHLSQVCLLDVMQQMSTPTAAFRQCPLLWPSVLVELSVFLLYLVIKDSCKADIMKLLQHTQSLNLHARPQQSVLWH